MYLSKLEVIGFKSFAQRIDVAFDSGVTAIVGPNGCGKTNIVDAIRWALGEQRYSTLRSDKMEDVIFNGTKSRKPLGLAEVSLTIENTKGILPTEYSEVTITRRVFRSGESEYLLNKVPCRLKDILDLFMDTGMGSDAYSVIELKMVESILSDKADERRKLFEEAAGVTKYKHRRKAAYRKLEDVRLDLSRVNDIVKEVQKNVNSLERQAKKAEQYNEVSARLRSLEIDLLEREYAYHHNKLTPLEQKYALAQTDRSVIDEALKSQEDHIDRLRDGLQEIEQRLVHSQREVASQSASVHRSEERALVSNERLLALQSNIERYEHEKADLHAQREVLSREHIAFTARRQELGEQHSSINLLYEKAKVEYGRSQEVVEAKKLDVHTLKEKSLYLAQDVIHRRGEQERLSSRIEHLRGRIDRATEDAALYEEDIKGHEELINTLTINDKELRKKFASAEVELGEQESLKKSLRDRADSAQQKMRSVSGEIGHCRAKKEFLQRMIDNYEGYSEGAKYLLEHERWKAKKITTLADIISASEKYRNAIDAVVGEFGNCLIVDSVQDGYAALHDLQASDKGNATFICLQWIPKVIRKTKRADAVRVADIIGCDDKYRPLFDFLFDDVVIVETLDQARQVLAAGTGVRCLTTDGQFVTSSGMLRGGSRRSEGTGLVGKREQISDLDREMKGLQVRYASEEKSYNEICSQIDAIHLQKYADAVKSIEKEMTAVEMRIAQLEFEKKRANDGLERMKTDIVSMQQEILDLQKLHAKALDDVKELEQQKNEQETSARRALVELESLETAHAELTGNLKELEINVVTLQSDSRNVDRDIERTDARTNDIQITLLRRDEEITHAKAEIERLSSDIATLRLELEALKSQFEILEREKQEIELAYTAKRNELHQLELKIKDERRLHDDAIAATHDLEMKISELKSAVEHLRSRAQEDFELELQLKTYPDDEFVDFAQRREEVKTLKDRIKILGAINFAAFDEFTTESERLTFLTQQRDDLIEAEQTLLSTIDEINTTAQRKFSETFSKIRENFVSIFKELFMEGDECDLRIEEGMDPLEANIEIIAKPRGKRPTSIDLLSGGEKTLTAIALLFAIYLVKPSPFCILDEVDAPLDDSNIDRYTRIIKKFSDNTQFIVVTHNKRTMEAAQALYGVTMEEEGVSKIVTVRFNEEARVRSATVTG